MKTEIKKKWLEALRGGDYKQAIGYLRKDGDKFCCLGVLCDIHAKETGHQFEGISYMGDTMVLPSQVQLWAGLDDGNPDVSTEAGKIAIAKLNDDGKSFEDLAKIIEAQL